ncbi:hypothetical protein [Burkholderia lata]|uniref:hypothetical protein n=1 Tax=Burkholderia lata (strain ATCC 17760 / DSM 23089 / LMG 22485 / NCIMB 9086 / R18194 / 383) TaxID=482957 RepID=UPI0015841C24|nr:hypothetical protein [Burkholderia lata]
MPYQAWRCVGWTDETLSFLVVASRDRRDDASLPDGWLISGPEALVEVVSQWESGSFAVYVLDRTAADGRMHLDRVTGIWSEHQAEESGVSWLWYSTSRGEMRPCAHIRAHLGPRRELVNELNFDAALVSAQ